jgi:hypothetical protein
MFSAWRSNSLVTLDDIAPFFRDALASASASGRTEQWRRMIRRVSMLVAGLSLVLCVGLVVVWVWSYRAAVGLGLVVEGEDASSIVVVGASRGEALCIRSRAVGPTRQVMTMPVGIICEARKATRCYPTTSSIAASRSE